MIAQLSIGHIMHKPNGDKVYPIYLRRKGESSGKTLYIPEGRKSSFIWALEELFVKYGRRENV